MPSIESNSANTDTGTTGHAEPATEKISRVFVIGASGTAGQAAVEALLRRKHSVTCLLRNKETPASKAQLSKQPQSLNSATVRYGDVADVQSLKDNGFGQGKFDVLVSCLASRTGVKSDAWAIDYQAHSNALKIARTSGVKHMILLSAICVQKPLLEFQHAKLAFEKELIDSGMTYSIIRPTAFFKSLSGQVERVRRGKPYLMFGNGELTSCLPISDSDLGNFIAQCVTDTSLHNAILPIGGPGEPITPRQQGECLFELTGQPPRFRQVPVNLFKVAGALFTILGVFSKRLKAKAELARIGHYYATESMLVLNKETAQYDALATPQTGSDTLQDYYASLLDGTDTLAPSDHSIFSKKHHTDQN